MASREAVLEELDLERDYQDKKWGKRDHKLPSWLLIMKSLLDDAEQAWMVSQTDRTKQKILQAAAVGVAALELHGVVCRDV